MQIILRGIYICLIVIGLANIIACKDLAPPEPEHEGHKGKKALVPDLGSTEKNCDDRMRIQGLKFHSPFQT